MALQTSGPITATDICAEFSYPASTQWRVSSDGAGFISFTVGSIIKYSDFYGASASSGGVYLPLWSGGSVNVGAGSNQTNSTTTQNWTFTSDDGTTLHAGTHTRRGVPSSSQALTNGRLQRFSSGSWGFQGSSGAYGSGRPPSSAQGSWTLPVAATSGVNYELWTNTYCSWTETAQRSENVTGVTGGLWIVSCGSFIQYAGYTDNSSIKSTIGSNHNGVLSASQGMNYYGDCGADKASYSLIIVRSATLTTGRLITGIPGAQIIANGGNIDLKFWCFSNGEFSRVGSFFGMLGEPNNGWSMAASRPTHTDTGSGAIVRDTSTTLTTASDWNGTIDPNGSIASGWNAGTATSRAVQLEVVESGTY